MYLSVLIVWKVYSLQVIKWSFIISLISYYLQIQFFININI